MEPSEAAALATIVTAVAGVIVVVINALAGGKRVVNDEDAAYIDRLRSRAEDAEAEADRLRERIHEHEHDERR